MPGELEVPSDAQQVATSQVVAQFAVVQAAVSSSEAQPVAPEEALLVAVQSEAVAADMSQHLSSLFLEAVEAQQHQLLLYWNSRQNRLEDQQRHSRQNCLECHYAIRRICCKSPSRTESSFPNQHSHQCHRWLRPMFLF